MNAKKLQFLSKFWNLLAKFRWNIRILEPFLSVLFITYNTLCEGNQQFKARTLVMAYQGKSLYLSGKFRWKLFSLCSLWMRYTFVEIWVVRLVKRRGAPIDVLMIFYFINSWKTWGKQFLLIKLKCQKLADWNRVFLF